MYKTKQNYIGATMAVTQSNHPCFTSTVNSTILRCCTATTRTGVRCVKKK